MVGVPDEYSGEIPLAFVALNASALARVQKNPAEAERIKGSIAKHVADHKVAYKKLAGGVEIIEVIPKVRPIPARTADRVLMSGNSCVLLRRTRAESCYVGFSGIRPSCYMRRRQRQRQSFEKSHNM